MPEDLNISDEHPLYNQLRDLLRQDITNGVYTVGQRIPTEPQLCEKYSVSRNTVRNAVNELVKENLLVRKQGKGTFVTQKKMSRPLSISPVTKGFTEQCYDMGCVPGSKVIKSVFEDASPEDIELFGEDYDGKIIAIERIRTTDGTPVSLEITRFPQRFSFLLDEDLNNASMFKILREKYGIILNTYYMDLELVYATYEQAHYLSLKKDYPLLRIYSNQKDHTEQAACRSIQYIVGDRFKMIL